MLGYYNISLINVQSLTHDDDIPGRGGINGVLNFLAHQDDMTGPT